MNLIKKFLTFVLSLSLLCGFSVIPTMAAEITSAESSIDYLNYDFPDDAVVLYQGENGVVYQSKISAGNISTSSSTYAMNYNGQWLDKGVNKPGSFIVKNPHTIINRTYGTFNIESNYSEAECAFVVHGKVAALSSRLTAYANRGDVNFDFKCNDSDITIQYYPQKISWTYGMRLNCWLW